MRPFRAVAATVLILFLLLGPPALLALLVGNPYPPEGLSLSAPLSDAAVLGGLTVLTWLLWAQLAACLLTEGWAALTDRPVTSRLPAFTFQRDLARVLVTAALASTVTAPLLSTADAYAAPTSLEPATGSSVATETTNAPTAGPSRQLPPPSGTAADLAATGRDHDGRRLGDRAAHHQAGAHSRGNPGGQTGGQPDEQRGGAAQRPQRLVTVERGDTLWSLAETHLGDGERWSDIDAVNRGRTMTDGSPFVSSDLIRPGWMLRIPDHHAGHAGNPGDPTGSVDQPRQAPSYLVGPGDTLWGIAEDALGDSTRYPEVFEANRGAPQPGGGSLTDADHIEPGWRLSIPHQGDRTTLGQPPRDHRDHQTRSPDTRDPEEREQPRQPRPHPAGPAPDREPTRSDYERPAVPTTRATVPRTPAPPTTPPQTPAPETATPRPADGDRGHLAASDTTDQAGDQLTALRALLAAGGCLAGGMLLLLLGQRTRQWRTRRPGRTLARVPQELQAVERAVVEAGATARQDVEFLDLTLRALAHDRHRDRLPLPPVVAAVLGADELVLHLSTALDPPDRPWTSDPSRTLWRLPRRHSHGMAEESTGVRDQPAPYPALVSAGVDDAGSTWLVDLEALGDVGVAAQPTDPDAPDGVRTADLQRYLAAELALNPWSHGVEVLLVDGFAETRPLNPGRLHLSDPTHAARRAAAHSTAPDPGPAAAPEIPREPHAETATSEDMRPGLDVLTLRRDRSPDGTSPLVIVTAAETNQHPPTPDSPRHTVIRLHPTAEDDAALTLATDGRLHLRLPHAPPARLRPLVLSTDQAAPMAALAASARALADDEMPAATGSRPTDRVARADGTLQDDHLLPRGAGDPATSLMPAPDRTYLERTATTEDDLAALAPSLHQILDPIPDPSSDPGLGAPTTAATTPPARPAPPVTPAAAGRPGEPTRPDPTGPDPTELDPTGPDPTELDPTGLDPTGLDPTGHDLTGLDPTLDQDLADWHDHACPRPKIEVLGPVAVHTPADERDAVANVGSIGGTIEFLVYLACQGHGITPDRAADSLGWSERTTWNRALDARRYLGPRPDGGEWLPEAPKSPTARARGIATYELHPDVLVSGDLFRRLRLRGQARGAAGIQDLVSALGLVVGQPLDQLRRGGYGWLLQGDRLDHHLGAAILDTAHLVATRSLADGDTSQARWACEIAQRAVPHAESPVLDLTAVCAAEGDPDAERALRERLADAETDPSPRTEQVVERRGWLAS